MESRGRNYASAMPRNFSTRSASSGSSSARRAFAARAIISMSIAAALAMALHAGRKRSTAYAAFNFAGRFSSTMVAAAVFEIGM